MKLNKITKIIVICLVIGVIIIGFWLLIGHARAKKAGQYLNSENPVNYLKASVLTPFSPLPYLKLGQTYKELGQDEKAKKEIKKTIWLCKTFNCGSEYEKAFLTLKKIEAEEAAEEADLGKLESSLASGLELNDKSGELDFWLSFLYTASGNYDIAEENLKTETDNQTISAKKEVLQETLDKILSIPNSPNPNPYPLFLTGLAYLKMNYPKMAALQFEKAVEIESKYRDAQIWLGKIYLELDELSKAQEHLEKATEIDPVYAETFYQLSLVYQKTKQTEKAQEARERAEMLEQK